MRDIPTDSCSECGEQIGDLCSGIHTSRYDNHQMMSFNWEMPALSLKPLLKRPFMCLHLDVLHSIAFQKSLSCSCKHYNLLQALMLSGSP